MPRRKNSAQHRRKRHINTYVPSAIRVSAARGQVNHRRARGIFFAVREGKVAAKGYIYCCPWCKATVSSNVKIGRVDHRTVWGNGFRAKHGAISSGQARVQACSGPGHVHAELQSRERPAGWCRSGRVQAGRAATSQNT